jgi:hypothetical protein
LVTDPGLVFSVDSYLELFAPGKGVESLPTDSDLVMATVQRPNLFIYYLNALRQSMNWPLFIVCLAGVAYGVWKRTPADVMLIVLALAAYLAISGTTADLYYPRYILPIIPVLAILGGRLVDDLLRLSRRGLAVVLVSITCVAVTMPTFDAVEESRLLTRTDTRTLAREWFDANVPDGARILIEGTKITPVRATVPLQDSAENIRKRITYWLEKEPRQAEFLKYKLEVLKGKTFELELVPLGEELPLDEYRDKGIGYFVMIPERSLLGRSSNGNSARLLKELRNASDGRLLIVFGGDSRSHPGPTIEIYQLIYGKKWSSGGIPRSVQ